MKKKPMFMSMERRKDQYLDRRSKYIEIVFPNDAFWAEIDSGQA